MTFDYSALRRKIVEIYKTQGRFAARMNLTEHTISSKLNNLWEWKQSEIIRACEVLAIPESDIPGYFFQKDGSNR